MGQELIGAIYSRGEGRRKKAKEGEMERGRQSGVTGRKLVIRRGFCTPGCLGWALLSSSCSRLVGKFTYHS